VLRTNAVAESQRAVRRHPDAAWTALLARMAAGEQAALAELYDATSHIVFALALRIVVERTLAEEVVLDVYTHAWRAAASYEPARGTPSAWLLTLARSRAIDALRARKRERATEPLEAAEAMPADGPGPEELSVAEERRHHIGRALAHLNCDQRQAIELAYFSGLSHGEIADRLGAPLGTVKTRIRLGMLRLRELLQPHAVSFMAPNQEKQA
jgi:RNA polymerase sigma-70 factor (ECF subfamily)